MNKTFKAVFALVFLLAASLFAQNMCIELCAPCVGKKKDQTCKKVEEHCQCAAILDSINAAQAAKEAELSDSQNKLSQELQNICNQEFCTSKVSFENGLFKKIALDKSSDAQKSAQALYENNFSNSQTSMTRIEPLPPLNEECSKFCGDCPVTDKMLKSKRCRPAADDQHAHASRDLYHAAGPEGADVRAGSRPLPGILPAFPRSLQGVDR